MRSLIGKFAMFFWLLYFAVVIPIFIFIHVNISSILDEAERSKIQLATKTLKPILSTYISFEQFETLDDTIRTFFQNPNILRVTIIDTSNHILLDRQRSAHANKPITITETLIDPITNHVQATLIIHYSNANVIAVQSKLISQIVIISLLALIVFLVTYIYFRNQFFILKKLSEWMGSYSPDHTSEPFVCTNTNTEILTITTSANTMLTTIDNYRNQMENINTQLEHRVENEIEQRRQKEQLLIHQSRLAAMGEMIESIAHQWRQPLNIIGLAMSNIEMKRELGTLDEGEIERNNAIINKNLIFMSNTIDDFRNFFNLNKERVSFHPIEPIQEIFNLLNEQLQHNQIIYEIENHCNRSLYGVVNEFKQVILNIINNAKDAILSQSQQGGTIRVYLHCDVHQLYLQINDSGGGIPSPIIKRVFDPYFTTKFQKQGTGIGLYMSKVIVEQHFKGVLDVENNDMGALFTITIPLEKQ